MWFGAPDYRELSSSRREIIQVIMRRGARHVLEQVLELAGRRYASQARHVADESATSGVRRRTSIAVASPLASVHELSRRFG
jgi:hypothetical protein